MEDAESVTSEAPVVNGIGEHDSDTVPGRGDGDTEKPTENGLEEEDSEPSSKPKRNSFLEGWIRIQANTFTNWINDKVRDSGLFVKDLAEDLKDGVILCKVMESVKGGRIGRVIRKNRLSHIESSGNLALAMQIMKADGIKLVNIG